MKLQKTVLLMLSLVLSHSAFAHSKAFTPAFVDTLIEPYLQTQINLAGDDLAASQQSATILLTALEKAPTTEDAKVVVASMQKSATAVHSAADLKVARVAFLALSAEFQSLVEHVGTTGKVPLFVAHCPMAFGGKGGSWIQGNDKVLNPYYGSMMLHCGSVEKPLVERAE
ncbi:MAG: DUF3347 domain-containing protein [Opitutaceae bacterium]